MNVGEICTREVVYCAPETRVDEIAQLMRSHHVGDLIVATPRGDRLLPVGIVTDRDLAVRPIGRAQGPGELTARDLMSDRLVTVLETEDLYDAIREMRFKGIRRLVVVDAGKSLVGVLTADDVIEFLAEELTEIARIGPRQAKLEGAASTAPQNPAADSAKRLSKRQ